jgi:hypothetical protein
MIDSTDMISGMYEFFPMSLLQYESMYAYLSNKYDPRMNQSLALTGSLFIISAWTAFAYENYITAILSFILSITSVYFHLDRNPISFVFDQIALTSVVIRSFFDGYSGGIHGCIICCVINSYNWIVYCSPIAEFIAANPDRLIANPWHSSIHIFAILGIILQQYCIANYSKGLSPLPESIVPESIVQELSPILVNDSSLSVL